MTETRYERSKRIEAERERHAKNLFKFTGPIADRFEQALEEYQPACVKGGLPSKWTDWATDPEDREDYETEPPTKEEAADLCKGCKVAELCVEWAKATGQYHGVYDGQRRENGRWIDGRTRPATKSMEDQL